MKAQERDSASLLDVLESAHAVVEYAGYGKRRFQNDGMLRDAMIRRLEVMGEAARRFSDAFREAHRGIPWAQIAGLRNVLIHQYDRVEPDELWGAAKEVERLLPALEALRKQLRA